ncbi:MAG: hypothetical protein M0R80_12905 [Proteobacteria bacterium]|jgi:hypothetical protein|nr:hypothetical protein [Pseudomonadota bacterium]
MVKRAALSICAVAALLLAALPARANMQSDRWFHAVVQDGRDFSFQIQLIEEDPPAFNTTFKLVRDSEMLFEHKQFVREEADAVVGPGCIELLPYDEPVDCDEDGTAECHGICGTAYRYNYLDECVPGDHPMYILYDEAMLDENGDPIGAYEGYFYIVEWGEDSADDPCLDSSGCSVAAVSGRSTEGGLAALMLLVGLGFAVVARRT